MNKSQAVIGLGFGDEGKGVVTDLLASQSPNSLVVRFSGGHQAGHTVVTDKVKHVFSNFGSGTLRGVPTYWSKFCTVDPVGIMREYKILKEKGIKPHLFIDRDCPITTPYDKTNNQVHSTRDGTCGVGFGDTLQREENHYSLTFLDLHNPKVLSIKLLLINKYYGFFNTDLTEFNEACDFIRESKDILLCVDAEKLASNYHNLIYEGSQGLLLDKDIGFFPHVTRANTGTKNLYKLNDMIKYHMTPEIYVVTRAYQTRHGNGPMTNEDIPHTIVDDPNETNQTHPYQGIFRKSYLDLDLLLYGIRKDGGIIKYNTILVITCLEHIKGNFIYTYKGEIVTTYDVHKFGDSIKRILGIREVMLINNHKVIN